MSGQCALNISLITSTSGLNFTGSTRGAVSFILLLADIISSHLLNGEISMILVSLLALYPLSISFDFSCLLILVRYQV